MTRKKPQIRDSLKQAYWCHKATSKMRGIPFQFDFETWVEWWETKLGSEWFIKRGRYRGQYVMGRNGDKGPYHPSNVECLLVKENDAAFKINKPRRGEDHHSAKLTNAQVIEIYQSPLGSRRLARRFNLDGSTVGAIRSGETWGHVTKGLSRTPWEPYYAQAKLKEKQVKAIFLSRLTTRELSEKYKVGIGTVNALKAGRHWQHITRHLAPRAVTGKGFK